MNKNELLNAIVESYSKLNEQIGKMTDDELNAPFQFANDPKKCGARWIYDQCTYTTDMAAYFSSVTTSPYRQTTKLLKTHQKNIKKN